MSEPSPLTLTADERALVAKLLEGSPGLAEGLREQMTRLGDAVVASFRGVVLTEAGVDRVLAGLVDRLLAKLPVARRSRATADPAVLAVAILTRHLVFQLREDLIQRLLAPKRN